MIDFASGLEGRKLRRLFQGSGQRDMGLVPPLPALATAELFSLSQFYTGDGQWIFISTRLEIRMGEMDEISIPVPRVSSVQAKQSGHAALCKNCHTCSDKRFVSPVSVSESGPS